MSAESTRGLPPVTEGGEYLVEPEELVAGGDALARIDGFPIFVGGIYPGDRAKILIVEVKKGYARGSVLELVQGGPHRRQVPCPAAETCGGCDWTSLRLDLQLKAKTKILEQSLRRVGKFDPRDLPPIAVHPSPLNYRLRSRLQVDHHQGSIGFFESGTHRVVPLPDECEVVGPGVITHLAALKARAGEAPFIQTFEDGRQFASGSNLDAFDRLSIRVRDFTYQLSLDSFFQVNRHLLGALIDGVMESAGRTKSKRHGWDLYAGVGFFSLPLSGIFDSVTAVEAAEESFPFGHQNASGYPNISFLRERVERYLQIASATVDFIMIDPPRAGLDASIPEALSRTEAEIICYLSCDPVTFARDASRLAHRGWKLTTLHLLDLFPNTHHVETLSSFERAR